MTKVAVGMSGGVDSTTAAALLQEKGYDVFGVTIVTHTGGVSEETARAAAKELGIPLFVLDLRDVFRHKVIDYFVDSYYQGLTPNPCVVCNQTVKFGALWERVQELGADFLATGHYIRNHYDQQSGRWLLYTAADAKKDQSYMLYSLNQEQIGHALFPLSDLNKEQIREIARARNFKAAELADSQEICFIPDNDYSRYIKAASGINPDPGDFIDMEGRVIGRHRGLIYYTVGQRKGLGTAFGKPMFVASLDPVYNRVMIVEEKDIFTDTLWAEQLNWIPFEKVSAPLKVLAKIRYKANPVPAIIEPDIEGRIRVRFETPQRAVTPGQSVVFYQESLVLGGGIIVSDKAGIRSNNNDH